MTSTETVNAEDLPRFGADLSSFDWAPHPDLHEGADGEDLVRVLTEPSNSLVRQYQHLFELDGMELEFTHDTSWAARHSGERTQDRRARPVLHHGTDTFRSHVPTCLARIDVARVLDVTRDLVERLQGMNSPEHAPRKVAQRLGPPLDF